MLNLQKRHSTTPSDSLKAAYGTTLARILAARGVVSPLEMDLSLDGLLPADQLHDLAQAVHAIDVAIDQNWSILVVGDFDCDGATSTALMIRCLKEMGANANYLVPDRFVFGYGLTPKLVQYAKEHYNPTLIITVDNGISSFEGVALATSLDIKVVITDHHLACDDTPNALAVVNPNQKNCPFDSKSLVGVGVAFYVMGALAKHRRTHNKQSIQVGKYLDLVALGTIADVGFLDKNNRILVAHGLTKIKQGKALCGINAILAQAGREYADMTVSDFGFLIAPRINAAGRIDNMSIGVECLLSDDPYHAQTLAKKLNELNIERRQIETQMKDTANQLLSTMDTLNTHNSRCVVLYQDDWHQGVIGIVAGRIKEATYTPTIIFAPADPKKTQGNDLIKGSARSIEGIHIRDILVNIATQNPDLIVYFGGHAMAAGLTIHKKDFERFVCAFENALLTYQDDVFLRKRFSDGSLLAEDFSLSFVHTLKNLTVWGQGFFYPSFDNVFKVQSFRILKDKHLKLSLRCDGVQYPIDAIWFYYDVAQWDYKATVVHILFELDINHWQGNQSLQLIIQDLAVIDTKA